jgi:glucarate dehydratase
MSRTVIRVTTSDGVTGLGESPSVADAVALHSELGERLVGRDCDELRVELGHRAAPGPALRTDARVVVRDALAGVEIALWDCAGKEAEVPLATLLGGAVRAELPFTEYFAYRNGREESPAAVAAYCASMADAHGSPWFEGKVGVRSPDEDLELVRLVREAIGPDRTLRLDANMGWGVATAAATLERLEPYAIANVEEPVATFEELRLLRERSAIPFSAHTPDLEQVAALGVPNTLVLGIGACGGVAGTMRFIERCDAAGVGFWFYSGDLGIATAAQLHVTAASPSLTRPSQSLLRWTVDDVIEEGPFSPERGVLRVPDGPGLGVTLDENALARCVERYARDGEYELYTGPPLPRW